MITSTQLLIGLVLLSAGIILGWRERGTVEKARRRRMREFRASSIMRRI